MRSAAVASPFVPGDPRRSVGARGEGLAEAHLVRTGYVVLERNFRTASGEIDLVATASGCVVFCEVRTRIGSRARTPDEPGGPLESIGPTKRRRLRRLAREWLAAASERMTSEIRSHDSIRFDAIGVVLGPDGRLLALEHVEDAF